jgi:hypothetical protein
MSAGLQLYGSHGKVQIDSGWRSFGLKQKGTAVCNIDLGGQTRLDVAEVTLSGLVNPVMAFRAGSDLVSIYTGMVSGSTRTYRFIGANGTSVDWYLFDEVDASGVSDTFGLEVFNAAGKRVFHSSVPPMRVVGQQMSDAGAVTYPSGRQYAVAQGTLQYSERLTDFGFSASYTASFTCPQWNAAGTQLQAFQNIFESYQTGSQAEYTRIGPAFPMTVIDVTHL